MKIIAITPRIEYLDSDWKYFCNETYIDNIKSYGWLPLIITSTDALAQQVALCDALLITGGYDILPHYYHESEEANATYYERDMDAMDFAIIDAFWKEDKPILGICRGIQLINVYFHGSLHQNIDTKRHVTLPNQHPLRIEPDTFFTTLFQDGDMVNSFHHQAINQLGEGLQVIARSEDDHIEAITYPHHPLLAVQWHPERYEDDCIFAYFFQVMTQR